MFLFTLIINVFTLVPVKIPTAKTAAYSAPQNPVPLRALGCLHGNQNDLAQSQCLTAASSSLAHTHSLIHGTETV